MDLTGGKMSSSKKIRNRKGWPLTGHSSRVESLSEHNDISCSLSTSIDYSMSGFGFHKYYSKSGLENYTGSESNSSNDRCK